MVIQNKNNIPEGWKKFTLQQCVDIDRNSLSEKTADNKDFFYIDLSAVSNGHITFPKAKVCFRDAPSRARRIIHKGDIIFSTVRPYLKGFALIDFNSNDYIVSTGFSVLTAKNSFSSKYIYHYLFSENFQKQIFISLLGGSFPALNSKDVQTLSILIPVSVKEQQKIVEVLETWDKAIQLTRQAIKQKKLQKKYLMRQLLTGRTHLKGFSNKWKSYKLNELATIHKGKQLNSTELTATGEYPCLNGGITPSGYTHNWNSEKNTISISEGGNSCGYVNWNSKRFWAGGHCYTLSELKADPEFLYFLLKYKEKHIMSLRVGSGLPNIQRNSLENLILYVPNNREEQSRIGRLLVGVDLGVELLQKRLSQLKEQKKGLMQVLLTGKVRLQVKK